jgi:hypothetical protein
MEEGFEKGQGPHRAVESVIMMMMMMMMTVLNTGQGSGLHAKDPVHTVTTSLLPSHLRLGPLSGLFRFSNHNIDWS